MAEYQRIESGGQLVGYRPTASPGTTIPLDSGNSHYQTVQAWIAAGNVLDAADPPPPPPFRFDFGDDDPNPDPSQSATAIANLRAYLAVSSPTLAQTAGALKLLIRVALFVLRRVGV